MIVGLSANNVPDTKVVHRLVATAFLPNPENRPQVNHINGVKIDNRACNLEWATPSENTAHAMLVLGRHPNRKLTDSGVLEIRRLAAQGLTSKQIAERFDTHPGNIRTIVARKTWKHL